MSLKLKAAGIVGLVVVQSILVGLGVYLLLTNFSKEILLGIAGVGFVGYMLYIGYSIVLSQLEYKAKLIEMTNKD